MTALENWNAQRLDRYAQAHAFGLHDAECEQRERSSLCHCSKRRRLAAGITEPSMIRFRAPECSRCLVELDFDGDDWRCDKCSTSWPSSAMDFEVGKFNDDYGDDIGGEQWGRRLIDLLEGSAQ